MQDNTITEDDFDNVVFRVDGIRLTKLKSNRGEVTFTMSDYNLAQSLARKAYAYIVDLLKSMIRQCEEDMEIENNPIILEEIRDDMDKFEKQLKGVLASGKQNNEFQKGKAKPQSKPKNKQKSPQKPQKKQIPNKPKGKKHKKPNKK